MKHIYLYHSPIGTLWLREEQGAPTDYASGLDRKQQLPELERSRV